MCDLETSRMRKPWPTGGCRAKKKKILFPQVFEKWSARMFHEKPSGGSRAVACGQTDRHKTKLIVTFRNFANASKDYVALKRRPEEIPCRRDNSSKNLVMNIRLYCVYISIHTYSHKTQQYTGCFTTLGHNCRR